MSARLKLTEEITVGLEQPAVDDIKALAREGFRTIIDLRVENEGPQPLPPSAEAQAAAAAGLKYAHVPVAPTDIDDLILDRINQELAGAPKPVFIHSMAGRRAGMFALVHISIDEGLTGAQTLARAEERGVLYDRPEIKDRMRRFVDLQRVVPHTMDVEA